MSDIHGNRDALEAVLADAAGGYDRIVCCGDLVGYGPDADWVVDWARDNLHAVVRGNHDRACCGLESVEWFSPVAQEATRWTIGRLSARNAEWLRELPQGPVTVDDFDIAHGSPVDEDEYVVTGDEADWVYEYLERALTFVGHTHLQGGFAWFGGRQHLLDRPAQGQGRLEMRLEKDGVYLVNPGSVGQPRDRDRRAAYLIYDAGARVVEFRRVEYDFEGVRRRIELAGLPPSLGMRLGEGR